MAQGKVGTMLQPSRSFLIASHVGNVIVGLRPIRQNSRSVILRKEGTAEVEGRMWLKTGEGRQPIKIYCRRCEAVIDLGSTCLNCPRPSWLAEWASIVSFPQESIRRLAACSIVLGTLAACSYLLQIRTRHYSPGIVLGSLAAQYLAALIFIPLSLSVMFRVDSLFRYSLAAAAALVAAAAALMILDEALVRLAN